MASEANAIPDDLEQLRRRFEEFRAARSGRSRFPETLWIAAAEMAKRYGVNRTAQVFQLEYGGLRKRAENQLRSKAKGAEKGTGRFSRVSRARRQAGDELQPRSGVGARR